MDTKRTILNYELTPLQDAYLNYLVPALTSSLLYIFLFGVDVSVVYRHYVDENPVWGSLSLFFICFPSLICYIVTISNWDLWPEPENCRPDNVKWFVLKTVEHLCFPLWAMWRYAERIFWSIEAVRSATEDAMSDIKTHLRQPRTAELYFFFQAFLHCLPQMLLQLHTVMRRHDEMDPQTAYAQVISAVLSLAKLAATISFYQRFKSQKMAGKNYPWYKSYKHVHYLQEAPEKREEEERLELSDAEEDQVEGPRKRKEEILIGSSDSDTEVTIQGGSRKWEEPSASDTEDVVIRPSSSRQDTAANRRSSDLYLEPSIRNSLAITLRNFQDLLRETSIADGPLRRLFRQPIVDEPDFNIRRLIEIKGLTEDDLAGKSIAFCWWFCFLLSRVLAISAFAYFYAMQTFWILVFHFGIVMAFLLYDANMDEIKRGKAVFLVFLGLIYIFCIIEFKIKFKKTYFIYTGYFILVFVEDFAMCTIWWIHNLDDLHSAYWFQYMYYIIVMCSVFSFTAMIFYLTLTKPEKVVVERRTKQ